MNWSSHDLGGENKTERQWYVLVKVLDDGSFVNCTADEAAALLRSDTLPIPETDQDPVNEECLLQEAEKNLNKLDLDLNFPPDSSSPSTDSHEKVLEALSWADGLCLAKTEPPTDKFVIQDLETSENVEAKNGSKSADLNATREDRDNFSCNDGVSCANSCEDQPHSSSTDPLEQLDRQVAVSELETEVKVKDLSASPTSHPVKLDSVPCENRRKRRPNRKYSTEENEGVVVAKVFRRQRQKRQDGKKLKVHDDCVILPSDNDSPDGTQCVFEGEEDDLLWVPNSGTMSPSWMVVEEDINLVVKGDEVEEVSKTISEKERRPKPLQKKSKSKLSSRGELDVILTANGAVRRKHHRSWSLTEVTCLLEGVELCGGGRWADIKKLSFSSIAYRTAVDLKDKWRNLLRASRIASQASKDSTTRKQKSGSPMPSYILERVRELAAIHDLQQQSQVQKHSVVSTQRTNSRSDKMGRGVPFG